VLRRKKGKRKVGCRRTPAGGSVDGDLGYVMAVQEEEEKDRGRTDRNFTQKVRVAVSREEIRGKRVGKKSTGN